jgi:hypothetical protein
VFSKAGVLASFSASEINILTVTQFADSIDNALSSGNEAMGEVMLDCINTGFKIRRPPFTASTEKHFFYHNTPEL